MSVFSHRELPSQQSSSQVHPSKGLSQFKAPLRRELGIQSVELLQQGQRYFPAGSTSSKGPSQFKAPLRREPGIQSAKLLQQDRPYATSGAPPFNGASFLQVINPPQPVVRQTEKQMAQSRSHSPSERHLSDAAFQHPGATMSLPRVQAFPSVVARDTFSVGEPITEKSGVLPSYLNPGSTDPYVVLPVPLSSLEALRQKRSSQFLGESDRAWRPALPQTEARMRLEALRRRKTYVMMKVILMAGTFFFVGGIASFILLHFLTYLVVTWAILIIVFSNLVSRELRSYYRQVPTTQRVEAPQTSTISPSQDEDMGRHPLLKDITGTTDYLKALCLVFKNDYSAQTFPLEREYKV
jgi:hypothetical protein